MKLFINVWPEKTLALTSEFTEEYVKELIKLTDVETSIAFDADDAISLLVLNAADKLLECFREHDIDGQVGIIFNYSRNYPGWLLIVETDNLKGSINPLVAKFFNWERIESQSILSFNEFLLTRVYPQGAHIK